MDNFELLGQAFLQRQPQASAAQLQEFAPEEAARFLAQMPLTTIISVLRSMASWPAAQVLSQLPATKSAEVLRGLSATKAETLLRLIPAEQRDKFLKLMPNSVAKSFRLKLTYPLSTVGAWMDTSIPYFMSDSSVANCLDQVKHNHSHLNGIIMVVNEFRHLLGLVSVDRLLTSDLKQPLLGLIDSDIKPISTRVTLWEAKNHIGWTRYPTLPVIGQNNVIVGALTHSALTEGTNKSTSLHTTNQRFHLVTHMGRAFFVALAGLIKVIWGIQDSSPTQQQEKPSHD